MTQFLKPTNLPKNGVVVIGVPLDENSSHLKGPALAPSHIREKLNSGSANLSAENGFHLGNSNLWKDVGDISFSKNIPSFPLIEENIGLLLEKGLRVLTLGGDHSITYPIIKAYAKQHGQVNILHLDAHPDLYHELGGNRYSHACPFARIMEKGLARRLTQVGIRTLNDHQREQVDRFDVECLEMKDWNSQTPLNLNGPLYLSIDMDALDPAYAPGVSHHEPGGLTSREVINIIQSIDVPIIGADIVELNPKVDVNGMTAMVAAKLLKEILGQMLIYE